MSLEEKQCFLREKVLENGYDSNQFMNLLVEKRGEKALDLDYWSMPDLKLVVNEFIRLNGGKVEEENPAPKQKQENQLNYLKKELNKYNNENFNLKKKIEKLKKENLYLQNKIQYNNKIINNFKNQLNNINNNNNNNKINDLKNEIMLKEKEIKNLKNQLNNNNCNKTVNYNDIIVVQFTSTDQKIINRGIKCLKTDTFAQVEEKLYQIYEEFRETNNTFMANAREVLRFKTMNDNNIKDGDTIQLMVFNNSINI